MKYPSRSGAIRRSCFAAAIALALGACTLGASPVRAQDAAGTDKTVSINIQGQPVQTALKLLFSSAGKNYSIDPAVQGVVTLNIQGVTFDVALSTLLRAANPPLQSDIVNGVYEIKVKQAVAPVFPGGPGGANTPAAQPLVEGFHTYRIPIDRYDASDVVLGILQAYSQKVVVVQPNYVGGQGGGQGGQGGGQGGRGGGGGFGGGGGGLGGGGGGFGGGGLGGGGGGFGGGGGGFGGGGLGGGGGGFGGGGGGGF